MLEVLIALVLLGAGFWAGRKSVRPVPTPQMPEEQELTRLREDRAAFHQLMGYSADRAYGLEDQ